jgi:hypothetical protein
MSTANCTQTKPAAFAHLRIQYKWPRIIDLMSRPVHIPSSLGNPSAEQSGRITQPPRGTQWFPNVAVIF